MDFVHVLILLDKLNSRIKPYDKNLKKAAFKIIIITIFLERIMIKFIPLRYGLKPFDCCVIKQYLYKDESSCCPKKHQVYS